MLAWALKKVFGTSHEREIRRLRPRVEAINALEPADRRSSPTPSSKAKTAEFKQKLDNGATLDDILHEAFAVCREAGKRVLKMRHYDVQLIGGMVLHSGSIAEMRTGEGKTLVATLPCYLNALEGKGVHVVTVNDYLARRDAEWMGKLYNFLGLSIGVVVNSQGEHEKKHAYRSRHHVRPEQRVRLRLPARQHEVQRARLRPARAQLRDRRRGRLDPHRRGAHAAHHQRPGRAVEPQVPADQRGHPAPPQGRALRRRREGALGHADRRRRRARAEAHGDRQPLRPDQPRVAPHPEPVPARALALQARRELPRRRRRQGPHHRRVHRPRPPRAPLERRPAPGGRGEGERAHPGRDAHDGDDHVPEPLPPLQEARRE